METKKCIGIYGHHFCVENGPYGEPIMPLHEFSRDATAPDGHQRMCKFCQSEWHKRTDHRYNPKKNAISSIAYRAAGGYKTFYGLPKEERQSIRDSATLEVENLDWLGFNPPKKLSVEELVDGLSVGDLINMGYENPNYTGSKRKKVTFKEDALPKIYKEIKRQPPTQQKVDYPPEGYVYVFRNRWHPNGIYKIGSTDNLEGRRSAARTWGPYDCEYYLEVKDCKLVESMVHEMLYDYRIDAGDLGKEHFSVDLEKATSIIKNVAFELACMHEDCAA